MSSVHRDQATLRGTGACRVPSSAASLGQYSRCVNRNGPSETAASWTLCPDPGFSPLHINGVATVGILLQDVGQHLASLIRYRLIGL